MPSPGNKKHLLLLLSSCLSIGSIEAFMQFASPNTVATKFTSNSKLHGYIAADDVDDEYDPKMGGVGLAEDNAILMIGKVDKNGSATATSLKHYTEVSTMDEAEIKKQDISVVCKGAGVEVYQDPGLGTESMIILSPYDAVSKALDEVDDSAKSSSKYLTVNFAGGDDLMVHEVLESVQNLVSSLDMPKESKIKFRSLCHASFPADKCGVAVLAGDSGDEDVYWHEGQWWTLREDNLNPAIA